MSENHKLPNGSYHYRISDNIAPIVCEILAGWVWECGEPNARPLKDYQYGKWVRLVEENDDLAPAANVPPEAK